MALGLQRLRRPRGHAGRRGAPRALARQRRPGRGCACSTRTASVVGLRERRRRPARRASTSTRPPRAPGVGARLHDDALERLRAAGHAAAWLWVFTANAQGRALLRAPRLARGRRAPPRAALGRRRAALRAGAVSVLVAVTDHAVERFRQRVGGSLDARAGDRPPRRDGLGGRARVRGAAAGRQRRARLGLRARPDRPLAGLRLPPRRAHEVVVITLWEQPGGVAPPKVGREWTDALRDRER